MVKSAMALPWWKIDRKQKHYRVNKDTTAQLVSGITVTLKKGSFIAPTRKTFLPRGHRWVDQYDETSEIVADTGLGFAKLRLEDVDL